MPLPETERRLEELKANQRKRGVIEPLVGMDWKHENLQNARDTHKFDIKAARHSIIPGYGYYCVGTHYEQRTKQGFPEFEEFVQKHLARARQKQEKIRWLDIGPGLPKNFMRYFEGMDPENNKVELHTLAPHQILPERKRTGKVREELNTSGRKMRVREMEPNPQYAQWKDR
ncbi:MAG: hypothetical protein V1644_03980, partial [Candidatus Micrarchaeota archaeon]